MKRSLLCCFLGLFILSASRAPAVSFIDTLPASTSEFFVGLDAMPFVNTPEGDLGNAWFCAEASALAYKDQAFIEKLKLAGWTLDTFVQESTLAILLHNDHVAVLAFRGTRVAGFPDLLSQVPINLTDLTTDFTALLQPTLEGDRIHQGFLKAYSDFWKVHGHEILARVGSRPLFITGHSLGAAIATVAARYQHPAALYTFGSPLVGDQRFLQVFEDHRLPVYRFVHNFDLVTTVPLDVKGLEDYVHVGSILHIAGKDPHAITRDPQHTLQDALRHNASLLPGNIVDSFGDLFEGKFNKVPNITMPDDALVDHTPMNYTQKLQEAAKKSRQLPPP